MMRNFLVLVYEYVFDWFIEHIFYPILTLGKVERDWD